VWSFSCPGKIFAAPLTYPELCNVTPDQYSAYSVVDSGRYGLLPTIHPLYEIRNEIMSKAQKSNKESKKQPAMTAKEKKAAKKLKRE